MIKLRESCAPLVFMALLLIVTCTSRHAVAAERIAVVKIMNAAVARCLDAYWSNGQSGTYVALYHCDESSDQKWALEKVPYSTASYNTGLIQIRNIRYSNLCLDVKNGVVADRTPVWLYTCWPPTDSRIKAQLFDMTFGFYNTQYGYDMADQYGRISLQRFFSSGGSAMTTWMKPFFPGSKVLEIADGLLNGQLQPFQANADLMTARPYHFRPNQIFALIKTP